MNDFIYLARYYPEDIIFFEKIGFNRNYSVNKKINGVLCSLKTQNNRVGVISTTADIPKKNSNFLFFKRKYINVYAPKFFTNKFRFISYIQNIISTTIFINKFYKKNKDTIFICWDFLPDTFLPVIFSKIPKKNICIDIEELIQSDPEANIFFKIFERISLSIFKFNYYFLSSINLKKYIPRSSDFYIFNGFFSENLEEENKTLKKILNYKEKKNDFCNIFYTGRLDNNRGFDIIIELCNKLSNHGNLKFFLFTFGDYKNFKKLKQKIKNKNFYFFFEEPRELFLEKISQCHISLNLIKDYEFAKNSFPSKLIDYFLFTKIIISTAKINTDFYNHFTVRYNVNDIYESIINLSKKINSFDKYHKINQKLILEKFSINYHKKNLIKFK